MKFQRYLLLTSLLFILIMFGWMQERTRPFIGHHDWDNVYWTTAGENFQRYGLVSARFQQIFNPYPVAENEWDVNQHHPPGISIITYFAIELFGDTEFSVRLMPIFASLIAAACLLNLSKNRYGRGIGLLSVFFFSFTPIMVYFSAKIGHEQFTLCAMLLFFLIFQKWRISSSRYLWYLLLGLIAVVGFISWAWYLFLGIFAVYIWCFLGRTQGLKQYAAIWLVGLAAFIGLILLNIWQQPEFFRNISIAFRARTTNTNPAGVTTLVDHNITVQAWFIIMGLRLLWLPTPVVTIFGIVGIRQVIRTRTTFREKDALWAVIAAVGIVYTIVFWQASFIHDYLLYYVFPPLAVWAAIGFESRLHAYGKPARPMWQFSFGVILVLFLVGSWRWSTSLYDNEVVKEYYDWGKIIQKSTQPDEVALSNIENNGQPQLAYYARRAVLYSHPDDEVMTITDRPDNWGYYIFCRDKKEPAPGWLTDYTYQQDRLGKSLICYLIDLKP